PPSDSAVRGNLNVAVDAKSGDILSMYSWEDEQTPKAALPKYSRAEAEKVAREVAAKVQPLFAQTRLVEFPKEERFWGGPITGYTFQFERVVNGYPYPNNSISVEVDANTLKVTSYRFNWDRDIDFPQPGKIIGSDEAEQAFLTKGAPRLIYFRPNPENNKDRPLKLVYDLSRTTSYMVDAKTGEVKPGGDYWYGPAGMGGMAKEATRDAAAPELSPAEQAEVTELASLLTQDQAIAKVKDVFKIPSKMKLERAHLSKSWEYTQQRQWNFSWDLTEKDKGGESISASVDARTGDLLQYYHYRWSADGDKKPAIKYKKDQAQKIAADFIAKYQPERFADCKLEEIEREEAIPLREEEQPRSYSFNWVRYANEIPFPQQGFRLEVSAETGEITSYNMMWADHDFPTPEGIMNQEEVNDKVFSKSPLVLEYLPVPQAKPYSSDEQEIEVGLFYHVRSRDLSGRMVDAKTGAFLDSQGNPMPDREKAVFVDLEGHPAAEAVALLTAKNIVQGSPDGLFYPDDTITQPAYLVMLLRTTGYQPRGEVEGGPWYKQYEDQARRRRILKDEDKIDPVAAITREQAAVWTVRALEQDRIASLEGIWNVPAKDAGSIKHPGYVALYLGQNLDPDRQESFRPAASLTRAQAAQGMVLFLSQERYY
ncbi:MAG: S-layer homology domain-containing protein, partial [bacterium]